MQADKSPTLEKLKLLHINEGRTRLRGEGDGRYSVEASSTERFHDSIYQNARLVENKKIVTGMSYRMTLGAELEGAHVITADETNWKDFPYVDITTFNSWVEDVAQALIYAGIWFTVSYSHVTFVAATWGLSQHSPHRVLSVLQIKCAICLMILVDYCAQLIWSWRLSRHSLRVLESTGDLVKKDDLCKTDQVDESNLSTFNYWKVFFCVMFMNLLNLPSKLQVAPLYFHTSKRTRRASIVKIGSARAIFVGCRNYWEFRCEDREGHIDSVLLSIATATVINGLKAWSCTLTHVTWGFVFAYVVVPIVLELVLVYDALDLREIRRGFQKLLEADVKSHDPALAMLGRARLKRYFGIEMAFTENTASLEELQGQTQNVELVAQRVDVTLAELQPDLRILEVAGKFQPGETSVMLEPIRTRMKQATFPCFFEVASLTDTYFSPLRFPHSLGPFSLQPLDVRLVVEGLATPTAIAPAMPTPWTICFDDYPQNAVAASCAEHGLIKGILSPIAQVSLEPSQKLAVGIPEEAQWYAWSYPVAASSNFQDYRQDRASDFLLLGGYVYFDSNLKMIRVLTARTKRHSTEVMGLLGFRKPLPVGREGPLAELLSVAQSAGGYPVSGSFGEEWKGLRFTWLPSGNVIKHSAGGFLFFYEDYDETLHI